MSTFSPEVKDANKIVKFNVPKDIGTPIIVTEIKRGEACLVIEPGKTVNLTLGEIAFIMQNEQFDAYQRSRIRKALEGNEVETEAAKASRLKAEAAAKAEAEEKAKADAAAKIKAEAEAKAHADALAAK